MVRRILQVGAGVVLGLVTVLVLFPLLTEDVPPDDPHLLPAPYPAPDGRLTDHRGRPAELPGDFDGLTVVFFGYTHCPDVCPMTMAHLAEVADRLDPELAGRFRTVLVTVDPTRDTPERLAEYVARFDSSFVGLTGSEEEIRAAASAWGAWAQRAAEAPDPDIDAPEPAGGGERSDRSPSAGDPEEADPHAAHGGGEEKEPGDRSYLVDHTARAFVVDTRGRIVATFPPSTPADAMLPTIRYLLEERR